jgi:hypothetical protein
MKFKYILIKDGIYGKEIKFTDFVNLIYSKNNSSGKTTLLRIMLYGLGYDIPSTKKLNFDKLQILLEIYNEKEESIKLVRINKNIIEFELNAEKQTFILPEQREELLRLVFGSSSIDVLDNLLGSFYMDQEKGWTLLNRGVVIGSIHFNIERLIRGLSDIDCSDLIKKEKLINDDIEKYKQMEKIAEYRESLKLKQSELVSSSYKEEINSELDQLLIQERILNKELRRIDSTLSDNKRIKKYIADMKLIVTFEGKDVCVTEKNIVGLNDSIELLIAKRKYISSQKHDISKKILKIKKERDKEYGQLSFFEMATRVEIFDKQISQITLSSKSIRKQIEACKKEKSEISQEIKKRTNGGGEFISFMSEKIKYFANELGLEDIFQGDIFTSELKSLTGALLHKLTFAFRLGYILAIEKKLNIKLPIILDSPSGKEVDKENISKMMDILKRDFSDNQIIIASIFEYNFDEVNKIEIKNMLLEEIIKN